MIPSVTLTQRKDSLDHRERRTCLEAEGNSGREAIRIFTVIITIIMTSHHGAVRYSLVTIVNNTVLHIGKLLREILKVLITRKKNLLTVCVDGCNSTFCCNLFVIYTNIDQYVVHLKLMLYVNCHSFTK